jgi:hypothetical protein
MKRFLNPKTVLGTLVLTLLLGVISSGLWDFLFKPGITKIGRVLLAIVTFGSESIRDSAYASAALDPTPLPALVGVLLASWLPLIVASGLLGKVLGRQSGNRTIQNVEEIAGGDDGKIVELLKKQVNRRRKLLNWLVGIFLVVLGVISLTTGAVLNQSIAVWRLFHANIAICSPYIPDVKEKQLRGRFASMTSRQEYMDISGELAEIAKNNGIKLQQAQLW